MQTYVKQKQIDVDVMKRSSGNIKEPQKVFLLLSLKTLPKHGTMQYFLVLSSIISFLKEILESHFKKRNVV